MPVGGTEPLDGLKQVADDRLLSLTRPVDGRDLDYLLPWFRGAISGVGIASISAVLTAARPDRFCVIDEFALRAVDFTTIPHGHDETRVESSYRMRRPILNL